MPFWGLSYATSSPLSSQSPSLVLFDIDGTLIRRAGPQHREALEHAALKVFGVAARTEGIPTHGMLDTDILSRMLRREGIPRQRAQQEMPQLIGHAERYYARNGPRRLTHRLCPGVRSILSRIRKRGVPMLLVTGNFPKIGWRKLELAGIDSYFLGGAFAGMSQTRAGLARLAILQARREGWLNGGGAIALIGDSPNDIEAARRNRIRSIAVSSGINSHEELAAHRPDVLVERLSALRLGQLSGT